VVVCSRRLATASAGSCWTRALGLRRPLRNGAHGQAAEHVRAPCDARRLSEDMLALAQRRCPEAMCPFARVESLPLGSFSTDAVVSVRLMGHMRPEAGLVAFRELGLVA
jgi:hypothetical protein